MNKALRFQRYNIRILRHLWQPLLHSLGPLSSPAQLVHHDNGDDGNNGRSGGCDDGSDDGYGRSNPEEAFGLISIFKHYPFMDCYEQTHTDTGKSGGSVLVYC